MGRLRPERIGGDSFIRLDGLDDQFPPDMYIHRYEKIAPDADIAFIAVARNCIVRLLAELRRRRSQSLQVHSRAPGPGPHAVVRPSSRRLAPDYESFPGSSSRSEKSMEGPRSASICGRGDAG